MRTARTWLPRLVLAGLMVAAPFVLSSFRLGLLTEILIFGILAASLDLLVGFTGLPSLGHATYFGVGGYTAALVATRLTDNGLAGLVAATAVSTIVAVITGWLAVRTRGVYFLMLTLAFAQLLYSLALTWEPVTGGFNGLSVPSITLLGGAGLGDEAFYWYVLVLFFAGYLALRQVVHAPIGRAVIGIRENEARMRAIGYAPVPYKLAAFTIAGAFGGYAGALFAQYQRFISPSNVAFEISALTLVMVIIGGLGTLYGPVIGAAVVLLLRDELSARFEYWQIALGLIFVLFVYFLPKGLAGLRHKLPLGGPASQTPVGRPSRREASAPERIGL